MNGNEIGLIAGGIGLNFMFGLIYAVIVRWGSATGSTDGYTALLVIIGTAFTLTINQLFLYIEESMLIDGLLSFAGFASSGTPMALEYWLRRVETRRREDAFRRDAGKVT